MVNYNLNVLQDCEDAKSRVWNQGPHFLASHDVISHVTIGLAVGTFLLMANDDHASILHCYGDTSPQRFWVHGLDLLVSCDVIGHWPFDSRRSTSYGRSIVTMRQSRTVTEIRRLNDFGVKTLTCWSHVTPTVTWPLGWPWSLSYCWSMMTMRLSCTVMEI